MKHGLFFGIGRRLRFIRSTPVYVREMIPMFTYIMYTAPFLLFRWLDMGRIVPELVARKDKQLIDPYTIIVFRLGPNASRTS